MPAAAHGVGSVVGARSAASAAPVQPRRPPRRRAAPGQAARAHAAAPVFLLRVTNGRRRAFGLLRRTQLNHCQVTSATSDTLDACAESAATSAWLPSAMRSALCLAPNSGSSHCASKRSEVRTAGVGLIASWVLTPSEGADRDLRMLAQHTRNPQALDCGGDVEVVLQCLITRVSSSGSLNACTRLRSGWRRQRGRCVAPCLRRRRSTRATTRPNGYMRS